MDEGEAILNETGYRKPLALLKLDDRTSIIAVLLDYYLMIKVKAEMDQFKDGLEMLGFLKAFQANPKLWEPYLMNVKTPLSSGIFLL